MQLPFKYDDLLKDANGLVETKSTTVQEVDMKDVIDRDITNSMMDRVEDSSSDWIASDSLGDEIYNNLMAADGGKFSQTFFDDIAAELEVEETYDSLFGCTLPPHWCGAPISNPRNVFIKSHDCMWAGHCGSSEHKDDCDKAVQMLWAGYVLPPPAPVQIPPQVLAQAAAQQSLLKPNLRNAGIPVINLITPQTPPMSDDDQEQNKKKVTYISMVSIDRYVNKIGRFDGLILQFAVIYLYL